MSLTDAHAFAFSLATTLMAAIIIFQARRRHAVGHARQRI